jgi:hypothetical protein
MNYSNIDDRKTRIRDYSGKADAEPLLAWLNRISSKTDEEACMALDRVTRIIETIGRIQDKATRRRPEGEWKRKPKEIRDEEDALYLMLSNYQFVYGLDRSKPQPMVWTLMSIDDLTSIPGETLAVHHIVELAKQGLAWKVRKCGCGKYFFARLPAQRFHSKECAVEFWEKSPERKEQKRRKARDYYNLYKNKNIR